MLLTVKQLSGYLNIKPKTIYSFICRKTIPHYKIGKLVLFKQDEVETWINTKRVMPLDIDKVAKSLYNPLSKGSQATSGKGASK